MFPAYSLDYHLFQPYYSHLDYENTFKKEIEVVSVLWIRYESAELHEALLIPQEGSKEVKYYYYYKDYYYYFRVKTCCFTKKPPEQIASFGDYSSYARSHHTYLYIA